MVSAEAVGVVSVVAGVVSPSSVLTASAAGVVTCSATVGVVSVVAGVVSPSSVLTTSAVGVVTCSATVGVVTCSATVGVVAGVVSPSSVLTASAAGVVSVVRVPVSSGVPSPKSSRVGSAAVVPRSAARGVISASLVAATAGWSAVRVFTTASSSPPPLSSPPPPPLSSPLPPVSTGALISPATLLTTEASMMGFTSPVVTTLAIKLLSTSAALPVRPRLSAGLTTLTAVLTAMSPSALVASPPVTRAPITLPAASLIPLAIAKVSLSDRFVLSCSELATVLPISKLFAAEVTREPMPPDAMP